MALSLGWIQRYVGNIYISVLSNLVCRTGSLEGPFRWRAKRDARARNVMAEIEGRSASAKRKMRAGI